MSLPPPHLEVASQQHREVGEAGPPLRPPAGLHVSRQTQPHLVLVNSFEEDKRAWKP